MSRGRCWNFWLPDDDRTTGWTSHGYVFQLVCAGYGDTAQQAWDEAKSAGRVPDGFFLPETVTAVPVDAEVELEVS